MFVHRICLGFMFIHVVCLSAIPLLPVDEKKKTSVLSAANSEPLEPWEVNQELIERKGVHGFCLPLKSLCLCLHTRRKSFDLPLIVLHVNRKSKSHADRVKRRGIRFGQVDGV